MSDVDIHAPNDTRRSKIQLEKQYGPQVADVDKVWRNTVYPNRFELRPFRSASMFEIVGGVVFLLFGIVLIIRLFFIDDPYKTQADIYGFFLFYGFLAVALVVGALWLIARVVKYFRETSIYVLPNGYPVTFKTIRDNYVDMHTQLLDRPGYFEVEHQRAGNPIVAPGEITNTYSPQWTYAPSNMPSEQTDISEADEDTLLEEMLAVDRPMGELPERINFFDYQDSREPGHLMIGINENNDLVQMPMLRMLNHLVGGAIGTGKSFYLRSLVYQILSEADNSDLPIVLGLADIENNTFPEFRNCRHVRWYAANYVEIEQMTSSLLKEVERRKALYESLKSTPKDIERYNVIAARENSEPLPVVVIFYDEFSALMHKAHAQQKKILADLLQLALRARKYGIFLVVAGQSFKAEIVDSAVLGQFNFSIAFKVRSTAQSMSIIGQPGAEQITQPGEAFVKSKDGQVFRVQTFYMDDDELLNALEEFQDEHKMRVPEIVRQIVTYAHDYLDDVVRMEKLEEHFGPLGLSRRDILNHVEWMDAHKFTVRGMNNRRLLNWKIINET